MSDFTLEVKHVKQLLEELIKIFPEGTFMSFEGKISPNLSNEYVYAYAPFGLLRRNTRTPKQDFWVFQLEENTKAFLTSDFCHRVGLRKNIEHILAVTEDEVLFASYDNFYEDCTHLIQSDLFTERYLDELKEKRIIWSYK